MGEERYKAIIASKQIYKEIELQNDAEFLVAGNKKGCNVRFKREYFFLEFEIRFENTGNGWKLNCDENVYISVDGVMKLVSKPLVHGDDLVIKYQASDKEVFKISFMLDFDVESKSFDRIINLEHCQEVRIGGNGNCNIVLQDTLIGKDIICLKRMGEGLCVFDHKSKYGVYINGARIRESRMLKDYDFMAVIGYSFYYKENRLYTAREDKLSVNGLSYTDCHEQESHMSYPHFNRNTRIQYVIPTDGVELLPPETKPSKPKKNIVLVLVPALSMLALTIVLRGIMGNGGMFVIYSVCSMGLGAIMSVVTYISEGKEYKKDVLKREEQYLEYMARKEKEIQDLRQYELSIREKIYLSLDKDLSIINSFGKRLFEKDKKDVDFLSVYLGLGKVPASCLTKFVKQKYITTDDALLDLPEDLARKYEYLENAPIISNMRDSSAVGLVGPRALLAAMLKNMTLDISTRHFYNDVKLFYILNEEYNKDFQWLRWLPHVANDYLNLRNIVCDEESRNVLLEYLYAELSAREGKNEDEDREENRILVFVFDSAGIHKHPIAKYIEEANTYQVTFVFFEEYEEMLPKGCYEIIRLDNGVGNGNLLCSLNGEAVFTFRYEEMEEAALERMAVKMGAVSVDEVSLESELTKSITLFQLLDIMSVQDLDLEKRWETSQVYQSMAAPLGVKKKGEIVSLNISDKGNAHGPHGLVAGTTGSGKSEILQSYVLSMASLFHPYDVGFLIIDFKGGGMANQFRDLPHLMGVITNIDGREVNRSLMFIKAELVRRQELFSLSDVNHINDYIKLYKKGYVEQPLPHLIMIVDEFAELKAEYPEFMKEIISAARIGRTLGVHLILATQKPSGVVDNQIWSNSKFKLCLKVQTKEDSNEVIKTPLAAEIVEPGRAYFQVGNNEIFELFQSAFSGAKVIDPDSVEQKEFALYELNQWGRRKLVYTNKGEHKAEADQNQLQALVEYIHEYCRDGGIASLPGICLPPLPEQVFYGGLVRPEKDIMKGLTAVIGIYDDPEQQTQDDLSLNLSESNTYIIGSAQSGKTTLLQTIVYSLMGQYTPEEVNIYIIDAGNMAMKVLEGANHIGGVALAAEDEKVINLFRFLLTIVGERKNRFAQENLGTFKAYLEAGFRDMPQIIFIIDNISVFREQFSGLEETLLQLSREGMGVGINLVVTGTQTNSIGYKVLANYGTRISYSCNDKGEYNNLFGRCRIEPRELPGRGLISREKRVLEYHTALCVEGSKEFERVEGIKQFIRQLDNEYGDLRAPEIPVVPELIAQTQLMNQHKELYRSQYKIPAGMDYDSISYESIDLASLGFFVISGKERSGKTNFIRHMLTTIQKTIFTNVTEAYIFDGTDRQLSFARDMGFVKEYTIDSADAAVMLGEICDSLALRNEMYSEAENQEEMLGKLPLMLIIVENPKILTEASGNKELSENLLKIMKQYRNMKVCLVFSNLENAAVGFGSGDVVKAVKDNKKAIVFEDVVNLKLFDTTMKQQKEFARPIRLGDAYLIMGNRFRKIKTIYSDV